jgi:hypothetical protein
VQHSKLRCYRSKRVSCDRRGGSNRPMHVRFTPKADKRVDVSLSPLSATSRHMQCSKMYRYSITSSASASSLSGTETPSDFAVLRLSTNSNLVDCSTGRSAGFAPLRIFPV